MRPNFFSKNGNRKNGEKEHSDIQIQIELSSEHSGKEVGLNIEMSRESEKPRKERQTKMDIFLNRVKSRKQMNEKSQPVQEKINSVHEPPKNTEKFGLSKYSYNNRSSYSKAEVQESVPEKSFGAILRERQEKRLRKRQENKIKYQKQRERMKEEEKEKKREAAEKKLADISAIFGQIGMGFKTEEKAKQKNESLKNLQIFNQLNEEAELMKGIVFDEGEDNRYKRANVVVKKVKLESREKIPSALIRLLLSFQFSSNLLSPERKRVPNIFEDQTMYKKTFHYLVTNECIADIHARMKNIEDSRESPVPIEILFAKKNTEGLVEITMKEVGVNLKDCNEEKEKFTLKNYALSKNRLGIITNTKKFEMNNFGLSSKKTKIFAFLCLLVTPQTKQDLSQNVKAVANIQIPDLELILKACRTRKAFYFDLQKISTHIREYMAITNLYDNEVSTFIYNPTLMQKNQMEIIPQEERKELQPMLQCIQRTYNYTQYESIREMVIRQSGIVLLQGPPGTGKTTTLMGLLSAEYYYLKKVYTEDKQKILICAPSNAAVDHITKRLVNEGLMGKNGERITPKILRIGIVETDDKDIRSVYLDDICDTEVEKEKSYINKKNNMTTTQVKEKLLSLSKERKKLFQIADVDRTLDFQTEEKRILTQIRRFQSMLYEHRKEKIYHKQLYHQIQTKKLEQADIVLTTLSSSGSEKMEKLRGYFGCLIVDEAAQSTQPNLLIPLQTGVKKVLLIGDPCQLPSTTISQDSIVTLFNRSLFERLLDSGIKPYFLNIQYRMAPLIRQFSSTTFYRNRLIDAQVIEERYTDLKKDDPLQEVLCFQNRNALFVDVKYSEEKFVNNSYKNVEEAMIVKNIALRFLKNSTLSIGIITPYQSQRKLLSHQLKNQLEKDEKKEIQEVEEGEEIEVHQNEIQPSSALERLMINTVDSFQGQEKDIIIVSMVRSNDFGEIGFMRDERRINVALTRSRHVLIVVGNGDTLGSNEIWNKFLNWTTKNCLYYPIQNYEYVTMIQNKIWVTKHKNQIKRKIYEKLSKDERKEKRNEIRKQDFQMGKSKKKVKKERDEVFVQQEGEKSKDYNMNIDESRLVIQEKRQKEIATNSFEEMNKRMKEMEEKLISEKSPLSQLFK